MSAPVKPNEQPRLVPGAAGRRVGRVHRGDPADDRRQLLGAGHLQPGRPDLRRLEWFRDVSRDPEIRAAFLRTLLFSAAGAAAGDPARRPLGVAMPRRGWRVSLALVIDRAAAADPVERRGHHLADLRPRPTSGWAAGSSTTSSASTSTTPWTPPTPGSPCCSWTSGTGPRWWRCWPTPDCGRSPTPYYQAAQIDGASAWAVFRHIQLPRLRGVLTIAILLRFMDSFMIYTEPFVVTGGGPGNATSFLSILLSKIAVGQFDLGPAGRLLAAVLPRRPDRLLRLLHRADQTEVGRGHAIDHRGAAWPRRAVRGRSGCTRHADAADPWMFGMSIRPNAGHPRQLLADPPADLTLDNYRTFFTDPAWYSSYLNSIIYTSMNAVMSLHRGAARRLTPSPGSGSPATSTCSSGC